jgi:hypothetical protein
MKTYIILMLWSCGLWHWILRYGVVSFCPEHGSSICFHVRVELTLILETLVCSSVLMQLITGAYFSTFFRLESFRSYRCSSEMLITSYQTTRCLFRRPYYNFTLLWTPQIWCISFLFGVVVCFRIPLKLVHQHFSKADNESMSSRGEYVRQFNNSGFKSRSLRR